MGNRVKKKKKTTVCSWKANLKTIGKTLLVVGTVVLIGWTVAQVLVRYHILNLRIDSVQYLSRVNKNVGYELLGRSEAILANTRANREAIQTIDSYLYARDVKPSYDYLRSVTVYIKGSRILTPEEQELADIGMLHEDYAWRGTGTVVKIEGDYTYILTNKHVAGDHFDNVKIEVDTDGVYNLQVEASVVATHPEWDLAIISVNAKLHKQVIDGLSVVFPTEPVYVVGNYMGESYVYSEGVVSGYTLDGTLMQLPISFGNSGSGVFDKHGKLVAVVYALYNMGFASYDTSKAICVPSYVVHSFLYTELGIE